MKWDYERIENTYTYHKPDEHQQRRYLEIREKAKEFAYLLLTECPESREKAVAMTKLQEVVMWANASIAINEDQL